MLKILRRKGVMKKILWVIAILIILIFGFLGQAYLLKGQSGPRIAGKIFGRKISLAEFQNNFHQVSISLFLQYGTDYRKLLEQINMEARTWDRIILIKEAKRRGIKVSDQEVIDLIQNISLFKLNEVFNQEQYESVLLRYLQISPRLFEEGLRDSLAIEKLRNLETAQILVNDQEVLNLYKYQNEKIQISYILFENSKYTSEVVFDESKAKDYYLRHREDFLMPPLYNVEFVRVSYPEEATEEDKEKTEDLAFDISTDLTDQQDLHAIAEKYGLPVETSGFVSIDTPRPDIGWSFPVLQEIQLLKTGEISEPLQTEQGYQFIKITDKKESYIPEYPQAAEKVKAAWMLDAAKKIAKQKAEEAFQTISQTFETLKRPNFSQTAKDLGLEIFQTPVFNRGQYLPVIGISKNFQDTAFSLSAENPLSDVVPVTPGYAILNLDSKIPVDMNEFEKKKEDYQTLILDEKKNTAFGEFLSQARIRANLEDYVSEILKQQANEDNP